MCYCLRVIRFNIDIRFLIRYRGVVEDSTTDTATITTSAVESADDITAK